MKNLVKFGVVFILSLSSVSAFAVMNEDIGLKREEGRSLSAPQLNWAHTLGAYFKKKHRGNEAAISAQCSKKAVILAPTQMGPFRSACEASAANTDSPKDGYPRSQ